MINPSDAPVRRLMITATAARRTAVSHVRLAVTSAFGPQGHSGLAGGWPPAEGKPGWDDGAMEVLSSRILLRPADLGRSHHFYRDVLGLAIYREFGPPADPGLVFFLGTGFLEVSGHSDGSPGYSAMLWLQVRDIDAEHERLAAAGVRILRGPVTEPWGLAEMWIEDPDGNRIVLVEVPPDHPLRRDARSQPGN